MKWPGFKAVFALQDNLLFTQSKQCNFSLSALGMLSSLMFSQAGV